MGVLDRPVLAAAVVALVIIVFTMMLSPNKKNAKADEGDDAQGEESSETEEDLHADGEQMSRTSSPIPRAMPMKASKTTDHLSFTDCVRVIPAEPVP